MISRVWARLAPHTSYAQIFQAIASSTTWLRAPAITAYSRDAGGAKQFVLKSVLSFAGISRPDFRFLRSAQCYPGGQAPRFCNDPLRHCRQDRCHFASDPMHAM